MARLPRINAVGEPHHVIQRGNRRQKVFFSDSDKTAYLKILNLQSKFFNLEIWAYCLMDNHVHLVVLPREEESLTKAISETHRLYTRMINFREKWRGYLWQGRFKSAPLDERYLYAAVRYVERNPVRARIVQEAGEYKFSSAGSHVNGTEDDVLTRFYLQDEIRDWADYLKEEDTERALGLIRRCSERGRPIGDEGYIEALEKKLDRTLYKRYST